MVTSRRLAAQPKPEWQLRWLPRVQMTLLTLVLLVFTLLVIIPFVWMILMSVRTTGEILNNPYGLPTTIRWQNYTRLLFDPQIRFYRFFYNSVFTTGFALLLTGLLATLAGIEETVLLYHGTWTVNSLAHVWGSKPYKTRDDSRNSAIVALWTMGEGWHNNHHRFPASERQGFYWWQIDGSHMVLKVCSWLGLVRRLREPSAEILAEPRRGRT